MLIQTETASFLWTRVRLIGADCGPGGFTPVDLVWIKLRSLKVQKKLVRSENTLSIRINASQLQLVVHFLSD